MLSLKIMDDESYSNYFYFKNFGLEVVTSLKEFNVFETRILKWLNWKIQISEKELKRYFKRLSLNTKGMIDFSKILLKISPSSLVILNQNPPHLIEGNQNQWFMGVKKIFENIFSVF